MIDVEADDKRYQKMHVDGGAMAQVFYCPSSVKVKDMSKDAGIVRERHLYVIRNARLEPDWDQVERQTISIAGHAIAALIQTQAIGDLYELYTTAKRDNIDL
jgi:hypothetical protein